MKKEIYIKIKGMTCNHCKEKIETKLKNLKGIIHVEINLNKNIAIIEYTEKEIKEDIIINAIIDLGYKTSLKMITRDKNLLNKNTNLIEIIIIFISIIAIYFIIKELTGFDFFTAIPTVNSKTSLSMLFVVGVITSIHCIGMCGGIVLSASIGKQKSYKNSLMYNFGRIISYTLIGGLVGLLGSVLSINNHIQFVIVGIASVCMFLVGLSKLNIISFKISAKLPKIKIKSKSPFIIGLLNGLMPCGALQSMQLYAISTGSFILGALSMFLFALGTVPLMLLLGIMFNFFKAKVLHTFQIIGAILIIFLSIIMFSRALTFIGIDTNKNTNYDNYVIAEIKEEYQLIEIDISSNNYEDIVIQKGIPVKFVLKVTKSNLNGCNNAIIIKEWNIKQNLNVGDNTIEFTPNKTGNYLYTCWMNMIKNHILVVDNLDVWKGNK